MVSMTTEEMITYDQIVDRGIATSNELNLAYNLIGRNWADVFKKVLQIRTNYDSLESIIDAEDEGESPLSFGRRADIRQHGAFFFTDHIAQFFNSNFV